MTKLEGLRACVFDAYGTLFDVHGPMRKLGPEIGPEAEQISKLWRQKQLEYTWLRSLMGVHADFWHVTSDALDYALEAHGVSDLVLRPCLAVPPRASGRGFFPFLNGLGFFPFFWQRPRPDGAWRGGEPREESDHERFRPRSEDAVQQGHRVR